MASSQQSRIIKTCAHCGVPAPDENHRQNSDSTAEDPSAPPPLSHSLSQLQAQVNEALEMYRKAKSLSATVRQQWATLRDVIQRHEATIRRRWVKKSRGQKLKILLKAWPGMLPMHRPDVYAFRNESQEQRDAGTAFKAAYLWPHINQEALSKPRILLLLLNARARHAPSSFSAADLDEALFGPVVANVGLPSHFSGINMILSGGIDSSMNHYGKIVGVDISENAAKSFPAVEQFGLEPGLLILEVQARLYSFLVACCSEILHDIPTDSWTSDTFPILPEPSMKSEIEPTGFESLAVMAAEAPYRVPAKLDLGRIESLLAARAAAAEDRLWALREDPLFLRDQILEVKEHMHELHERPWAEPIPKDDSNCWVRAFSLVVQKAFFDLEVFSYLRQQADELKLLQIRHSDAIAPDKDLPKEYLNALLGFYINVWNAVDGCRAEFKLIAPSSPALRHLFVDLTPPDITLKDPFDAVVRSRPGAGKTEAEKSVTWLLDFLFCNSHGLNLFSIVMAVDELERLVEIEPEVTRLFTPATISVFSDLSIVTQCARQIKMYYPWAKRFHEILASKTPEELDRQRALYKAFQARVRFALQLDSQSLRPAIKWAEFFKQQFAYPIEKRRTKENVEALRTAEQHLDAFWECIDRIIHKTAADLDGTATKRLLSQNRVLQRTPEWVEPALKKETATAPASNSQDVIYKPLSTLYFGSEPSPTSQSASPSSGRGKKTKTKGLPRQPCTDDSASKPTTPTPEAPPPPTQTFPVDARALKVFRVLFHNPDLTSTPGEVSWTDFLHAMTSTGFVAQKLYGSVWQFQPTRTDMDNVMKGIQFHEPHPKGKLRYWVARRYGRRLQRAYGWCGTTFVLREK